MRIYTDNFGRRSSTANLSSISQCWLICQHRRMAASSGDRAATTWLRELLISLYSWIARSPRTCWKSTPTAYDGERALETKKHISYYRQRQDLVWVLVTRLLCSDRTFLEAHLGHRVKVDTSHVGGNQNIIVTTPNPLLTLRQTIWFL